MKKPKKKMPTIKKLPKKQKTTQHSNTDRRKMRFEAYNTTAWKKLRLAYMKEHPLCEECLNNGKVKAADSIHHKQSPFIGNTVNWALFLDRDNLESICAECHARVHAEERGYIDPKTILEELERLLDDSISDEEFE